MLLAGKTTGLNLLHIILNPGPGQIQEFGILFDKAGNMPISQPQKVVNHQNLAVARGPGTDTDRGNFELLSNAFRDIGGNAFQHHGKSAGSLDLKGIGQKVGRSFDKLCTFSTRSGGGRNS